MDLSPFRFLLLPLSILYAIITLVRNKLFDWGVLPSASFDIPVIGIGNLSSGGTGKTPHTEFLIKLLQSRYKIAVLSRGYKRKTKGFLLVSSAHNATEAGDEPLQICRKFPEIIVAVHERRTKGIKKILAHRPNVNLVLLDDAFQHRYVKPGLNILLTDYYRPFFNNYILPCGDLREAKSGANRAHAIIVTKTPQVFSPIERKYFLNKISNYASTSNVFFSKIEYGEWVPMQPHCTTNDPYFKKIILFTGIANTTSIEEYLNRKCDELIIKKYPDHYQFSITDLQNLRSLFRTEYGKSKAIVITEKDAMRLQNERFLNELKTLPVFYVPIRVVFQDGDHVKFEKFVWSYLTENHEKHNQNHH